jgi:diguanylate cyclase (GGDEF)-like protein
LRVAGVLLPEVVEDRSSADYLSVRIFAERTDSTKRLMVRTAAGIYGGAAFVGLLEDLLPGGPSFSIIPAAASVGFVALLLAFGPRLPVSVLAALGPVGAGLIAYALATTDGPGDAAVLYMWPVLWVAYFFGRTGSVVIVACIGVAHGFALASMPDDVGNLDRWLDVMVSVSVVAAVVHILSANNRTLLAQLADEARVDQLTGVLNRRGFEERLPVEFDRARRDRTSVGVVSFDIDHFKRVNDEWGHETGDRVLAHLGSVLRAHTRSADVVARTGGEEFVTVLSGSDAAAAGRYAERVRAAFSAPNDLGLPSVTVSAGVATAVAPDHAGSLLHQSDTALYAAKRAGRDRTVVHGRPRSAGPGRTTSGVA